MPNTPRRILIPCLVALAACSGGEPPADAEGPPSDSITQRQRDSVIGESNLPGARGVRGALDASDAAAARAAALDSLYEDL